MILLKIIVNPNMQLSGVWGQKGLSELATAGIGETNVHDGRK